MIGSGSLPLPETLPCLMDTGQAHQSDRKRPRSPHLDALACDKGEKYPHLASDHGVEAEGTCPVQCSAAAVAGRAGPEVWPAATHQSLVSKRLSGGSLLLTEEEVESPKGDQSE